MTWEKYLNGFPKEVMAGGKMSEKRLYTVGEAASYLGLSPRTIYNGVAPGSKNPFPVKPKRYGKKVLFDVADLDRFADSLPCRDETK